MLQKRKMQRMTEDKKSDFEHQLLLEIGEIERHIKDLGSEKRALQRLLMKAQRDQILKRQVTRKNSVDRVLIETKVLDVLRVENSAVVASKLFRAAQAVDVNLKKNTFRSHLHRLKERGIIMNPSGTRGLWKLVPVVSKHEAVQAGEEFPSE